MTAAMRYQHHFTDRRLAPWPPGKIVCVGRNYADHARELNNPVPDRPILFIKPATAAVTLSKPLQIPAAKGACHHELEMVLLIGSELASASPDQALSAVAGVGLGLDLTLRDLQTELKSKGHPWERAKAFDGSCPLTDFVPIAAIHRDIQALELQLWRNGQLQQQGNTRDMLFPVTALLAEISATFTLLPGDLVMTGTPAGVGPLSSGDRLELKLDDYLAVTAVVA